MAISEARPQIPAELLTGVIRTPDGSYPVVSAGDEKLEEAPEVKIDLYTTLLPYNCDFATLFIPFGKSTPFQIVNSGKTVEYPSRGDFAAIIQHPAGTIEVNVYHESDPETYSARGEYEVGDILCCVAIGRHGSTSIEKSTPPYEPGMFKILEEADPQISRDFIEIRDRLLRLGKVKMGPHSKITAGK